MLTCVSFSLLMHSNILHSTILHERNIDCFTAKPIKTVTNYRDKNVGRRVIGADANELHWPKLRRGKGTTTVRKIQITRCVLSIENETAR